MKDQGLFSGVSVGYAWLVAFVGLLDEKQKTNFIYGLIYPSLQSPMHCRCIGQKIKR